MRTWDKGGNFFNHVPIQETAWQIDPHESITLRYRMVVLNGKAAAEVIEPFSRAYVAQR